jgi:hypothetical protein
MMTPNDALGASLLVIIAVVVAYLAYNFREDRKIRREDSQQRAQWESDVAEVDLPAWDGATYDWPETGLARYLDAAASWQPQFYQASFASGPPAPSPVPVRDTARQPQFYPAPTPSFTPASSTSGFTPARDTAWQPLSVYKPPPPPPSASDTDLYIAMIKARTDAHIAHMRNGTTAYLALPAAQRLAVTA